MIFKEDVHPNGTRIFFDENKHSYWTDNIDDFTSVTEFVARFFLPFEREKISLACAKKYGRSQEDVLSEWDRKNLESRILGSNVHLFCEKYLLNEKLPDPISKEAELRFAAAKEKLDFLLSKFTLLAAEKIIFSEELKLSGTVDLLVRENTTNQLYLLDFKTNRKIEKGNRFEKYAMEPFLHLADNSFIHYTIQLNIYKALLLKEGYYDETIKMGLIHFSPDGNSYSHRIDDITNDMQSMFQIQKVFVNNNT